MKNITRLTLASVSTLLLAAGFSRAAERLDPVSSLSAQHSSTIAPADWPMGDCEHGTTTTPSDWPMGDCEHSVD
jgi:hypothetical protein